MNVHETQELPQSPAVPATPGPRRRGPGLGFFIFVLAAAAAIGWFVRRGMAERVSAETQLIRQTKKAAVLQVAVIHPTRSGASQTLDLPGDTQPLMDAPIFARTNGYLSKWYADIGAHVKAGQLLAEIATPEVDHQLQQAKSDLQTAQTNLKLAETTAERYRTLQAKGAVARQDADNVISDRNSKRTIADAAAANVRRLEDLQSYEKVFAPFDGVITARNTDVGQLIDAGSSSPGRELFHISATNRLRVFISVPEEYAPRASNGLRATLTLNEFPGRQFTGTVVRNSNSIDPVSRTLLVEVDVDNPSGELLPGAYVFVHLPIAGKTATALTIPVGSVMFRAEGLRAAVVRDHRAVLVPIQTGRDFGDTLEVVAGLSAQENLIVNPPDSLVAGTPVEITAVRSSATQALLPRH